MSSYSISFNTNQYGGAPASAPLATVVAPLNSKMAITEIAIEIFNANTNSSFSIGRPVTPGSGDRDKLAFLAQSDPQGPNALSSVVLEWDTPPVSPAQFMRKQAFATAVLNVGVIFTFPRGLGVPAAGQLCIWNIFGAANNGYINHTTWIEIDE